MLKEVIGLGQDGDGAEEDEEVGEPQHALAAKEDGVEAVDFGPPGGAFFCHLRALGQLPSVTNPIVHSAYRKRGDSDETRKKSGERNVKKAQRQGKRRPHKHRTKMKHSANKQPNIASTWFSTRGT